MKNRLTYLSLVLLSPAIASALLHGHSLAEHAGNKATLEWELTVKVTEGDYRVEIQSTSFSSTKHRVTRASNGTYLIDGAGAWGVGRALPESELKTVRVYRKGRFVASAGQLARGLFNPHNLSCQNYQLSGGSDYPLSVRTSRLPGGKGVIIELDCADGAAAYSVKFTFNNDGKVARKLIVH